MPVSYRTEVGNVKLNRQQIQNLAWQEAHHFKQKSFVLINVTDLLFFYEFLYQSPSNIFRLQLPKEKVKSSLKAFEHSRFY